MTEATDDRDGAEGSHEWRDHLREVAALHLLARKPRVPLGDTPRCAGRPDRIRLGRARMGHVASNAGDVRLTSVRHRSFVTPRILFLNLRW